MTCKTWSIPSDHNFTPLCSMTMLQETARDMKSGCPICVSPLLPSSGLCVSCPEPPSKKYLVTVQLDGNGYIAGNPDYGCGSEYNRTFIVYNTGNCRWESKEMELRCVSGMLGVDAPVTCSVPPSSGRRPRVALYAADAIVGMVPVIRWDVVVYWQAGPVPGAVILNQVKASGRSTVRDCRQPVSASFDSRALNFSPFVSETWANPMVGFIGGGGNITMNASVVPFGAIG
jgi:hypothetical protein